MNISGTTSSPNGRESADQGQQGRDAQEGGAESGATIQAVPERLDALKWPLLGAFAVVFGVFAFLLSRKSVVAVAEGKVAGEAISPGKAKKPKVQPQVAPTPPPPVRVPVAAKAPTNGPANQAEVDTAIGTSLDVLKESLFRLELRHQAGTISEEEYVRERAKAEQVLRNLVRG